MPKINLLDSSVYNRIAAGEVVQQPSSVVKELLENSIDSGASEIVLEIKEGGIKEIRVSDNGCGIAYEDVKNAFLPHATSKVKEISDLDTISTLGFRGEALSSIASVSIVDIETRTSEEEYGAKLSIHGGNFGCVEQSYRTTAGTTMNVRNLFFNTPARAKFLKKPYQEEADVTSVVQRTIFANPNLYFTYVVDDKEVYKTNGTGLLSAIKSVYGLAVSESCLEINYEKNDIKVRGYVCDPTYTKPNRNYQTTIVNGRFVKDFALSSVVANAYGDRLMKRTFPVFILDILMPFDDVDVNVHPAKTEVRFKKQSVVFGAIYNAVKERLEDREASFSLKSELNHTNINTIQQSFFAQEQSDTIESTTKGTTSDTNALIKELLSDDCVTHFDETNSDGGLLLSLLKKSAQAKREAEQIKPTLKSQESNAIKYEYTYVGQIFDCYLLLQSGENFIIIDQHAAHERLLYDELISQSNNRSIPIQPMLLPFTATYTAKDFERIMNIQKPLQDIGIAIEEFGKYTIKISELPLPLIGLNLENFINGFLSETDMRTDFSYTDLIKEKLAARACKSAIKAGDKLQKEQVESILTQIIDSNMTLQCPHGRPVAIVYSKKDVEKLFKRIV